MFPLSLSVYRWAGRCNAVQSPRGFEGQGHPQRASRDVQLLPAESDQRGCVRLCHPTSLPTRPGQQQRRMCSPTLPASQCPPSARNANSCRCDLWHSVCHDGSCSNLRLRLRFAHGAVPKGDEEPRPASNGRVRCRDGPGGRTNVILDLSRRDTAQRDLRHCAWVSNQQLLTHCLLLILDPSRMLWLLLLLSSLHWWDNVWREKPCSSAIVLEISGQGLIVQLMERTRFSENGMLQHFF